MTARDVFLCHADGDKRKYARPLADALARRAVSTWVDEAELEAGDSIVEAVDAGLRLSRFVALLVTERFLSRNWTIREMSAAVSREIATGQTVVIPLLVVDAARWTEAFPLLADKLYLTWSRGVKVTADAIAKRFNRSPASEWAHIHPREYRGPVWVRCTPATSQDLQCTLTLRWGPYVRDVQLSFRDGMPLSLMHHKIEANEITLHATIDPPAIVTFGIGPAPDATPRAHNVDEGWIRAAGIDVFHPKFPAEGEPPKDRDLLASLLNPGDGEDVPPDKQPGNAFRI